MCCAVTEAAQQLLAERPLPASPGAPQSPDGSPPQPRADRTPPGSLRTLATVRLEVHVAGWSLAFERAVGRRCEFLGAGQAALSPPARTAADGRAPADGRTPVDVRVGTALAQLPEGRAMHDFLRTDTEGTRSEVDRFETIRPHARVSVAGVDLLLERDDRLPPGPAVAKLERYDHFLAGWSLHTRRYGRRREAEPVVVFICRDRARARQLARRADAILCACRAYAGEYPFDWQYPGRERILFAAERDVHEGSLCAYAVPRLPPAVRVTAAHGDPRAGEAQAEACEIVSFD
jgi:hypothetical protein